MARTRIVLVVAWALACGPKTSSLETASTELPESSGSAPEQPTDPRTGKPVPLTQDDPRISTSAGEPGGIVVLWPRIVPAEEVDGSADVARRVQAHAREVAEQALPGRAVDVRPEPERTCPKAGCKAVALGSLIIRQGDACALVAFVMPPGTDRSTALVPWSGRVAVTKDSIPFRAYPESEVKVKDFARCDALLDGVAQSDDAVARALQAGS